MMMTLKRSGKFTEFLPYLSVSRQTAYNWLNRYKDELISEGVIEEKKRGARKYIYVKDFDRFIEFMKDKDVYLLEE